MKLTYLPKFCTSLYNRNRSYQNLQLAPFTASIVHRTLLSALPVKSAAVLRYSRPSDSGTAKSRTPRLVHLVDTDS